MFSWVKNIFSKPVREREPEVRVVEKIRSATADLSKAGEMDPEMLKKLEMFMKDFEGRSLKEDRGGTSSSPISSP